MDFTVNGVRIPLAYTIWAKKELTEAFKDGMGVQNAFLADNDVDLAQNMAKMGSIMSRAYAMRQRSLAKLTGAEDDSNPIDEETLFGILDRDLTIELVKAITLTVADANKTTVEVKPEKKETATE